MLLTLGGYVLISIYKKPEILSFKQTMVRFYESALTQLRIAEVYMPG